MMSASSSKMVSKNVDKVQQVDNACKTKWLEDFLRKTFFDSCKAHPLHKNGLSRSRYCINCDLPTCKYCAASSMHHQHEILKIYRLRYRDVVTLAAMEKHIDCSQIQPYKCNSHLVIALKPLPHTSLENWDKACDICSRKLTEPDSYRYCSISCKVEAVSRKPNESVLPFILIQSLPCEKNEGTTESGNQLSNKKEETTEPCKWLNKEKEETTEPRKRLNKVKEETAEPLNKEMEETTEPPKQLNKEKEETIEPSKRKRRRKGIPHRAPFF